MSHRVIRNDRNRVYATRNLVLGGPDPILHYGLLFILVRNVKK